MERPLFILKLYDGGSVKTTANKTFTPEALVKLPTKAHMTSVHSSHRGNTISPGTSTFYRPGKPIFVVVLVVCKNGRVMLYLRLSRCPQRMTSIIMTNQEILHSSLVCEKGIKGYEMSS